MTLLVRSECSVIKYKAAVAGVSGYLSGSCQGILSRNFTTFGRELGPGKGMEAEKGKARRQRTERSWPGTLREQRRKESGRRKTGVVNNSLYMLRHLAHTWQTMGTAIARLLGGA